jgi:ADP-ribosylglycohydrolase
MGPAAPEPVSAAGEAAGRVAGVLLGLAAGDRNGGPVELALRLAESLLERRAFDREDQLRRFLDWHAEGAFDTGPVTGGVLKLMAGGLPAGEAAGRVHRELDGQTAGCNPAHRVAPLAMAAFLPDQALPDLAREQALLTHLHPLAGDTAAALAVLCRALVRGVPWTGALARATAGRLAEVRAALGPGDGMPLSGGGFSPEVLRAAVHFVGAARGFAEALAAALRFAGPPNYCPVLAGALGGARWGAAAIAPSALAHCRDLTRLRQAAARLAADWAVPGDRDPCR